jgi:hypothetical protein
MQQTSQVVSIDREPPGAFDNNSDGWDDFWVSTHYGHGGVFNAGDKFEDPDGDGVHNFEEMRRFTDPFKKDPTLLLDAVAIAKRRAAVVKARITKPLEYNGKPTTVRESLNRSEAASHARSIELSRQWSAEWEVTKAEAERRGLPLENLVRFEDGSPVYGAPLSVPQAAQVGADQVWPRRLTVLRARVRGLCYQHWDVGLLPTRPQPSPRRISRASLLRGRRHCKTGENPSYIGGWDHRSRRTFLAP